MVFPFIRLLGGFSVLNCVVTLVNYEPVLVFQAKQVFISPFMVWEYRAVSIVD